MIIGQQITLKAKTKHGKDRISQHGSLRTIKEIKSNRILVENQTDLRWIDLPIDRDFHLELS